MPTVASQTGKQQCRQLDKWSKAKKNSKRTFCHFSNPAEPRLQSPDDRQHMQISKVALQLEKGSEKCGEKWRQLLGTPWRKWFPCSWSWLALQIIHKLRWKFHFMHFLKMSEMIRLVSSSFSLWNLLENKWNSNCFQWVFKLTSFEVLIQ